jgi:uncharacterized protein (TIGR02270 family)
MVPSLTADVAGAPTQPLIRWDILAEHLERGAAMFERFEDARIAADHTLDELGERVEGLWLAHLDALLIAGAPAIDRLLAPIFADPTATGRFELMMATSVALHAGRWELLQSVLWSEDAELRAAIVRACAVVADASFDAWIVGAFAQATPAYRPVLLELAAARHLPLPSVLASLQSASELELAAASRAALYCDRQVHFGALEALIEHDAASVREAAIVTSLHWGSAAGFQRCRDLASIEQTCTPRTLRLLALLGDPRDHGYVVQAMQWPSTRRHAIRSLGFAGNLAAVELLLPLLDGDDSGEARLASEALALITGMDLSDEALVREADEDEDDDGDDPDITPGSDVPTLDPAAARAWWTNNQAALDANRRNLRGQTDLPGAMLRLLADGRMRDRPDLALSLAIRTGGRARVDCDALSGRQREQLDACAGTTMADFNVRHSSW